MRLFFAIQPFYIPVFQEAPGDKSILLSYSYFPSKIEKLEPIKHMGGRFILDSGAFTIWQNGKDVDLDAYAEIVGLTNEYMEGNLIAVNLDIIPGKVGVDPTEAERREAPQKGYENYLYLKKKTKATIMPVYHQHENPDWLHRYIKEKSYILGISPANDQSITSKQRYLDETFSIARKQIRCHGLAVTAGRLLKRYPWYSVDSATWKIAAVMGTYAVLEKGHLSKVSYKNQEKVGEHCKLRFADTYKDGKLDVVNRGKRELHNIQIMLELEKFITDLWKARGVEWSD